MIKEKDSYHDVCHNKSLAISFATGASRHRLQNHPFGMFSYSLSIACIKFSTLTSCCQEKLKNDTGFMKCIRYESGAIIL